jgi:hypothetical protein
MMLNTLFIVAIFNIANIIISVIGMSELLLNIILLLLVIIVIKKDKIK